jgi:hypothetical protein
MDTDQLQTFRLLKDQVQKRAASKLGIEKPLTDWSLQDIRDFQTDLEVVCKSSVSEKWIYTHFKHDGVRLPRIDVLNLLCEWIDYKNWDDFLRTHGTITDKEEKKKPIIWIVLAGTALLAFTVWLYFSGKGDVVIVFKDAYTQKLIGVQELTLKIKNQTLTNTTIPNKYRGDTLVVEGAYYKQKKIAIPSEMADTFFVEILPDDYALMLNFFSRSTADDLDKRRLQLDGAIHPEARIFQSHPQYEGIELLNKDEFIDRLLLPTNSLKNLEIQHVLYRDDKIYRLQFLQKPEENESK